jgi:hypothetical protein
MDIMAPNVTIVGVLLFLEPCVAMSSHIISCLVQDGIATPH